MQEPCQLVAFAALHTRVGSCVQKQNWAKAKQYLEAALTAHDGHAAAWHSLGKLAEARGDVLQARNAYMQGLRKVETPSAYLYEAIGSLARRVGLIDEARYWFREGTNTAAGGRSNALWSSWGAMEWRQAGDLEQAQYCFKMALKLYSRNRYVHLTWAAMERSQGNHSAALTLAKRGVAKNPTDALLHQVCFATTSAADSRLH